MIYKLTTYKTLTGKRKLLEKKDKKPTQWVVYLDKKPTFYVDCFDLQTESNMLMNNLVLCERKSIGNVLKEINEMYNVRLSIETAPLLGVETTSEFKELELEPIPKEWLSSVNGNEGIT